MILERPCLVGLLQLGELSAAGLREGYVQICEQSHRREMSTDAAIADDVLRSALRDYVNLNQLTWTCSVVKEPFTARYREFLDHQLPGMSQHERRELMLKTLITSERSYILRAFRDHDVNGTVWPRRATSVPTTGTDEALAVAEGLATDARSQHLAALKTLRDLLPDEHFSFIMWCLLALADLVDLTERKNTDLHRCGLPLFANAERREQLAQLCGLTRFNDEELDNSPVTWAAHIGAVLKMLTCRGQDFDLTHASVFFPQGQNVLTWRHGAETNQNGRDRELRNMQYAMHLLLPGAHVAAPGASRRHIGGDLQGNA
jgi:hypothetical protein